MDNNHHKNKNTKDDNNDPLSYLTGFGNELSSECLPNALPVGRNTPRLVPYGLYAEQLSGTAFTAPRATNRRTWLYRIQPSVAQQAETEAEEAEARKEDTTSDASSDAPRPRYFGGTAPHECVPQVQALRWMPPPPESSSNPPKPKKKTFVDGCVLMCHAGSPATKCGLAIYHYECHISMTRHESFCNTDGELLIVPQQGGGLRFVTELGVLNVSPTEIVVIPRGIVFSVQWEEEDENEDNVPRRGYMLEVYGGDGFALPEKGPIGSNGLANARDFLHPTAACDFESRQDYQQAHHITVKAQSQLFARPSNHSPYNVVAWHGNYLPYKYNLKRFCAVNSVTYDHLDPSIYTVLTCPFGMSQPGTALADVVLFPPRYLATDRNTLRPPWFHRNTMSEYMGLIYGQYDAKVSSSSGKNSGQGGFVPGGASLHNGMVPHGPDVAAYQRAVNDPCDHATYWDQGLAFMFETCLPLHVAPHALALPTTSSIGWYLDTDYTSSSWRGLTADHFTGWDQLGEVMAAEALKKKTKKKTKKKETT